MNFSAWAIKKPIPIIILFGLLTFAGIIGFNKISIKNFPDLDFPAVTITVTLPGATPAQLETQVTRKVEDSIANVSLIKHISSTIRDGSSETFVEFNLEKNLQEATDDVKDAVTKIQSQFPPGTNAPVISRVDAAELPILTYQIDAKMDQFDLSWFIDNDINKQILSVPGVNKVLRLGGVDREIQVLLDPTKLIALDTTINNISSQLFTVRQDFSGGRANIGHSEETIQEKQTINSALDIANLNIPLPNGFYVRLGNVATVSDTAAEVRQMTFRNGESITSFSVYPAKGVSEVAVANKVRSKINELSKLHPTIRIKEISNTVERISENYKGSMQSLYEGAILAILVVFIFLRDFRATIISATALPLSIIPTFVVIYWFGFSLNAVSLLAITLVIGVLVDDAIVEVENISRHLKEYKLSPIESAINAAQEIGVAVIATSLTLVAVFLPTAFMAGIPGRIFKQFGWTAAIAILFSLLVARLLTPMMAAYFMKSLPTHKDGKIMAWYLKIVAWALAHRLKTMAMVGVFFIASITLLLFIPSTFIPASDNNQIVVKVQVPPGSEINQIIDVMNQAYTITRPMKEILSVDANIGDGVQSGQDISTDGSVTDGRLTFNLIDSHKRKQSQAQLEKIIQDKLSDIPGAKFSAEAGNGEVYSLVLASNDDELLQATAKQIEKEMRELKTIGNINSDYNLSRPEVYIKPDFNRAAELGVTPSNMGQVIRIATSGDYSSNLAKVDLPDRQIPVRVELQKDATHSLDSLSSLRISGYNSTVPLSNVANISLGNGPVNVRRYDRQRSITFSIDLHGRNISEVDQAIKNLPTMKHLPVGVTQILSGDIEQQQELFGSFLLAMITGIICVYCVLVLLFNDFKQPITVLAALPLAMSGALAGLVLFGFSFSLSSLIGLLMLMGIVTKNSILLVDYIFLSLRQGNTRTKAIMDACNKRSRPIVMTSIAMVAGMLPIAFGLEGDPSFRAPMALTVITGLMTSTLLSLVVIPVIFDLVDEASFKGLIQKFKRKSGSK
jgi:multidrug efflux pump subunit AcrB